MDTPNHTSGLPPDHISDLPPRLIRYLKREDIDIPRWDNCMKRATNRLIYGFSFFLDAMTAGRWDALVLGDYEAVMPLTWRRKYGIRYLYQPAFTQQTGIFSTLPVSEPMIDAFLTTAARFFRFAEIFLNYANPFPAFETRCNFILPLDAPYQSLAAQYKKDLVRNLKLAARADLHYTSGDIAGALRAYRKEYGSRLPQVKKDDYRHFEKLCTYLKERGHLILRAVIGADGQTLASALLLRDENRCYLLQSTTSPAGRDSKANHFLLDRLIHELADTGCILDFEGSDLPGIAHFYANFGGRQQNYFFYRHNQLPRPWRWLKR
jgi:hypothetical protein